MTVPVFLLQKLPLQGNPQMSMSLLFAPSCSKCVKALQSLTAAWDVQLAGLIEQGVVSWDVAEPGNATNATRHSFHLALFDFILT